MTTSRRRGTLVMLFCGLFFFFSLLDLHFLVVPILHVMGSDIKRISTIMGLLREQKQETFGGVGIAPMITVKRRCKILKIQQML
uniref:Uncharacterized protein n=1 Tax=Pyxicephalus adspersus TaxID=30357 RepID=A0AAV2ZYP7_PYXAD|nr:TPA: hypothetical protein GDO54_015639 [Pyxicephalus adspersus]